MSNPIRLGRPGDRGYNRLCTRALAGVILGNFDRNVGTEAVRDEWIKRLLRPGAILLPNLDIDPRSGGRSGAADDFDRLGLDRTKKKYEQLDSMDEMVSGGDDSNEMATLIIRSPRPCQQTASRVILRIHPEDAPRIRVFESGTTRPVLLGRGKQDQPHETTTTGHDYEYELPPTTNPWAFHFQIEAVTLTGSPMAWGPYGTTSGQRPPSPTPPAPYDVNLPGDPSATVQQSPTTQPVYPHRLPGEVWFELIHLDSAGNELDAPRDVAVYTIAPWIMSSNLERAELLYMCDSSLEKDSANRVIHGGNQDTIADVERAIRGISGLTLRKIPSAQFTSPDGGRDLWLQDEFVLGYCWAVHNWMHVAVHTRRGRGLQTFVREHLPDEDMGLFDDMITHAFPTDMTVRDQEGSLLTTGWTGLDHGGNLLASPPVERDTPQIPADRSGPVVPAQRAAPWGKIVIGYDPNREASLMPFLEAQIVQPLLPVDVSWLAVGHIDEFVSFVPAPRSRGKNFRVLLAGPVIAAKLMQAARSLHDSNPSAHPVTDLFRGQRYRREHRGTPEPPTDRELQSVGWVLDRFENTNAMLYHNRLRYAEQRLLTGLDLSEEDLLHLPVFYGLGEAAMPPEVETRTATQVQAHSARLNGELTNSYGVGSEIHMVWGTADAERRLSSGAGEPPTWENDEELGRWQECSFYLNLTGLNPSTTYYFRVYAKNSCRNADGSLEIGWAPQTMSLMTTVATVTGSASSPRGAGSGHELTTRIVLPSERPPRLHGAFTPNLVNLQVINNNVLVPRPHGPCMKPDDVVFVLQQIRRDPDTPAPVRDALSNATRSRIRRMVHREYWGLKDETAGQIASRFGFGAGSEAVNRDQIVSANRGKFDTNHRVTADIERILIPENLVDLFEAYTETVLKSIGLQVHWVHTWYPYHLGEGGVHCGTKVKRRPPELSGGSGRTQWWDYYSELLTEA